MAASIPGGSWGEGADMLDTARRRTRLMVIMVVVVVVVAGLVTTVTTLECLTEN